MQLIGRTWALASEDYRFGFNGKEDDNETYGDGNIYDYGFRIYNPRLGRFLSVDPLFMEYAQLTPYQFASNTPISAIDIDGKESDKEFNFNDILKDGIQYYVQHKLDETAIFFKLYVLFNPYTRFAVSSARAISKNMVYQEGVALYNRAEDLDKGLLELQNFYHSTGFYLMEETMYDKRVDLELAYNGETEGAGAPTLNEGLYNSDEFYNHADATHPNETTGRENETFIDENTLSTEDKIKYLELVKNYNLLQQSYSDQRSTFNQVYFIYNFASDFSVESISMDLVSYYKDQFDWDSELGNYIWDEFKKLDSNSTQEEIGNFVNVLINIYLENSEGEDAYHINLLNSSDAQQKQ